MNEKKMKLMETLTPYSKNIYTLCAAAVDFIDAQPEKEREEYFKTIFCEIELIDFDSSDEESFAIVSELPPEGGEPLQNMGRLVPQLVKNLALSKVSQEAFYRELWNQYCNQTLVPSRESKIGFIMALWLDNQIPYFKLEDGIRMEDEEYKKRIEELKPYLNQALYILNTKFEQRTERASLLLRVAKQLPSEEEQTVFWATVTGFYENRLMQMIKESREQNEQTSIE